MYALKAKENNMTKDKTDICRKCLKAFVLFSKAQFS